MDLEVKLTCKPNRLSTATLCALISKFTTAIEQSVFHSMCLMHKDTSKNKISESIYGHIHLDIERVEKGSFILFITGAIAGTIASCFYDVVKKKLIRKLSKEEVTEVVGRYIPTIATNLERDLKSKERFGSLYVYEIHTVMNYDGEFPKMIIDITLGLPEKEHMPVDSASQIEYVIRLQEIKANRKDR